MSDVPGVGQVLPPYAPTAVEWDLEDVPPEIAALFFGGSPTGKPLSVSVEINGRVPGKAGLTRTQKKMAFLRGSEIPVWIWKMRANRKSMRHGADVRTLLPNAEVILRQQLDACFEAERKAWREIHGTQMGPY